MPSLETIRTVRIKGEADGVDAATAALNRLTASIQAANDNLSKATATARSSNDGWRITGEGAVSAANHLRQAAEAAYVFSPAFREVTNSLATPALRGATTALEAVAAGIVAATNIAGTGAVRLGNAIETTFPAFALLGVNVKAAGAWMEAFNPSLAGAATTILSRLAPALSLLGKGLLIYDAIKLVTQAWELGNAKLAEYVALSEKAAASGLSTDFYQRLAKAAEEARTPVEALTEAYKKLNEAAAPRLGGTDAQKRLDELVKAGNFGGNTGVGELKGANSNEERLRAVASLVDQALEKGQRLAAIDITRSFMGDQAAINLAKDAGYLDDLIEKADAIKAKDLISAGTIANAVELQNRLDAAEKILSQRWHPIQDILTNLGIRMKEVWVDIVDQIAKAVDTVFKLGESVVNALKPMLDFIAKAAGMLSTVAGYLGIAAAIVPGAGGVAGVAMIAGRTLFGGDNGQQSAEERQRQAVMSDARKRLAEGLNRKFDTSKPPPVGGEDTVTAYDRAADSVRKYIEVTNASIETVGKSVAEQEKAKIEAQLTAAAMRDGLSREAAEAKARMSGLGDSAAAAALALEKAKIASDIKFDRSTALLSQEDVQIAQKLKGIYGDDIPQALNSSYAAQIRYNSALREIGQLGQDVNRSLFVDFETNLRNGASAWDAFQKAGVNALGKIADKLAQMAADDVWKAAFGGNSGGSLFSLFGLGGGSAATAGGSIATGSQGVGGIGALYHTGGIVGSEPTALRIVHPAHFDGAPRFHGGGIAGDEVPIIARKGEGVFTSGQMAAIGQAMGGGGGVKVDIGVSVDKDGNLQAFVKKVAQSTTAQGIQGWAASPAFIGHVAQASSTAQTWRLGK